VVRVETLFDRPRAQSKGFSPGCGLDGFQVTRIRCCFADQLFDFRCDRRCDRRLEPLFSAASSEAAVPGILAACRT
jgi:hypothetical protein